jgi:hypothetical protein
MAVQATMLRTQNAQNGDCVHINGTRKRDGRSVRYSQFFDDGYVRDLSDADFGIHADIGAFHASGVGRNRPNAVGDSRFAC